MHQATASTPVAMQFNNWGYRHASRTQFAVRGLNVSIHTGEHVLLLGASGIGKSTILEGAAGLLGEIITESSTNEEGLTTTTDADGGITEGSILINGKPVHDTRGMTGLVLQDPDAQGVFQRIADNVAFGPENLGIPREEIWQRVHKSLEAVGLEGLQLNRSVTHLSGGQMQRLALAGALAMEPDILLLDEPTANLDPDGVDQIVGAVNQVLTRTQSTMLLVEHRADRWISMIDRVIVLGLQASDGSTVKQESSEDEITHHDDYQTVVVADGTPDDVFTRTDINFTELGIWVPEQYQRAEDRITRIHVPNEPDYDPATGDGVVVLHTEDLAIGRHNTPIAQHINIACARGQITALVGSNGAGKSTLSMTLAGLLEPVVGEVVASNTLSIGANGTWPIDWSSKQLASRISYVFQNPEHQFACSSVLDEVMLGPLRTGMSQEQAQQRAHELLKRFHLDQYEAVNPYTLSGGEKRRLTVAASLAAAPEILILDEPTFGQDRRTWLQIVELIQTLRADNTSIIVVTHDHELVTALGARVVELTPEHSATTSHQSRSIAADHTPQETQSGQPEQPVHVPVSPINTRPDSIKASSKSPFLASINPVFRLFGAFLVSLPLLASLDWLSASVALALEFIVLMCMKFTPWQIVKSTWPVFIGAPGSALAILLYGKSGGDLWWQWGWIHITDRSAWLALATFLRILAIGIPAIIAVLGIDATDLADGLSELLHLPDRFVYGGLAGMRLFSVLQDDWSSLSASRRSRGLGDDNKIAAFFPQAFALLVLSIRRSTTLATAMQARGFGAPIPRTHARISQVHARDWYFLVGCLLIPIIALTVAAYFGTFSFMGN